MKSILLASVAMVGFAGIAVAEETETRDGVSFSGTAEFGYNDTDGSVCKPELVLGDDPDTKKKEEFYEKEVCSYADEKVGFYWESDLAVKLSRALNNGLTASVTFNIDITDDDDSDVLGNTLDSSGFVLALTSEEAGLYFGDTKFAAQSFWPDADVDEMYSDGFSEQDGEVVLRGEVTYGTVKGALSYVIADSKGERPSGDVDQLSLGAGFSVGGYTFGVAYQDQSDAVTDEDNFKEFLVDTDGDGKKEKIYVNDGVDERDGKYGAYDDFVTDEIFAIGAKAELVGVDAGIAYASNLTNETSSLGISVAYPIGPFAVNAYYVLEDGTKMVDDPKKDDPRVMIEKDIEDSWGVGATYEEGAITFEAAYKETEGEADSRIEGTYDVTNGFKLWAGGVSDLDDYYIAGTVDLGGGAQLLVSYGVDDDGSEEDEIGNPDIQAGATVEVSLAF